MNNELLNQVGKLLLKMGEEWRCGEGAELTDAYEAAMTAEVTASPMTAGELLALRQRDQAERRVKELEAERDAEKARADAAEAERDKARAMLFPYADATEISGVSFDGKYLIGDKKSISYFHEMMNRGLQIDVYKRAYDERIAAAEATISTLTAERDALKRERDEARRALILIANTCTEDSHGNVKDYHGGYYRDIARSALSDKGE